MTSDNERLDNDDDLPGLNTAGKKTEMKTEIFFIFRSIIFERSQYSSVTAHRVYESVFMEIALKIFVKLENVVLQKDTTIRGCKTKKKSSK